MATPNVGSTFDTVNSLRDERRVLQSRLKEVEEENNDLIRQLRSAILRNLEPAEWHPPADSDADRLLDSILTDIKHWSERYATSNTESLLAEPNLDDVEDLLIERGCVTSMDKLLPKLRSRERSLQREPAMFLASVVASSIWRWIFADPFHALRKNTDIVHQRAGGSLVHLCELIAGPGMFLADS